MRTLLAVLIALASFCSHPVSLYAADPGIGEWTTFGNGASHSGYYPKTIGGGTFTAGWSKNFSTPINQAAVSGTTVYLTANGYFSGGVRAFALNATTGDEVWSYPLAECYSVNPPTFWNGRVYFQRCNNSGDTHLWCLNAATGALLWAAPFAAQWENYLAPAVVDQGAFIDGGSYGGLYGFDSTTGAQRFFVNRAQEDGWTPSYSAGVVYSCVDGSFLATSPSTGSQQWIADLKTTTTGNTTYWDDGDVPAVSGNTAAVIGGGRLVAMNLTTHAPRWFKAGNYSGTPAIANGVIYAILAGAVQAYRETDGASLGTYTASGSVGGQPIITNDLLLVASNTNTYIFDLATFQLKQTLPVGGLLSYAAGTLYVVGTTSSYPSTSMLATYHVNPSEADPPVSTVTSPPGAPQPHPNPSRPLGTTSVTWLSCQRVGDTAYFLFDNPAKIERYDFANSAWLTPISLPNGPKAFAVGQAGIFVSFGKSISMFSPDGSTETPLGTTADEERTVIELAGKLYLVDSSGSKFLVLNEMTGAIVQSISFFDGGTGFSASATKNKLFARSVGYSPSDILQFALDSNGTMSGQSDSPYHGSYPDAARTYLFPGEGRVVDNAGIIYSADDLSYLGSLAGAFDDLDFAGDAPVVLRGTQLVAYSNGFLETGRVTLAATPSRIFVSGANVVSFKFSTGRGVVEGSTPLAQLVPANPGTGVDPNGLSYKPDAMELGNGDIIYLLSKATQSIFRWSIPMRKYLSTIPLASVPQLMTYSASNNRLYLSYSGGRITKIDLDTDFTEISFANTPLSAQGLATAGEYLFAEDASGAWATHYVFSSSGQLTASEEWNYYSTEYIWNATNRKMYFFRDGTSPNDLLWEDIDLDGKLGQEVDSPYHGDYNIQHPLRVSPDGTQVVLGNGDVYTGISLTRVGTLGTNVADAAWAQTNLFTLEGTTSSGTSSEWPYLPIYTAAEIRAWDANRLQVGNVAISGQPLRMFAVSDGLVTVNQVFGKPRFGKYGFDLSLISLDPPVMNVTVTTDAATIITTGSAQLNGHISLGDYVDAHFEYGTNTSYGSRINATIQSGASEATAVASLQFLNSSTTYHYRLVVTGPNGPITGSDVTFDTHGYAFVGTGLATQITLASAQLNGFIPSDTDYSAAHFEWGTDTFYGNTTDAVFQTSIGGSDSFSASIGSLTPGVTYHFRLVATFAGDIVYGADRTFVTTAGSRDFIYLVADDVPRPIVFDLLAGFGNPNARVTGVTYPSLGEVFANPDGKLVYLPKIAFRRFSGTDSFYYIADDGMGNSVGGKVTFFNPFFRARGTYSGAFSRGTVSVTITSGGRATGYVRVGGETVRFAGYFDGNAQFHSAINDAVGALDFGLTYSNGQFLLTGSLVTSSLTLYQTAAPAFVSWHAGHYTLLVPPDPDNRTNTIPQGVGFALMHVSPSGTTKIAGRLADGKPFSGGGPIFVTSDGDSIFFSSVLKYPNVGTFSGTLVFVDDASNDCAGTFNWQRPAQPSARYSVGFSTTSVVAGSRFESSDPNAAPLSFGDTFPNARFKAGDGNLSEDFTQDFMVTHRNRIIGVVPNDNQVTLKVDSLTGLVTGSFMHPSSGTPVVFRGVVCAKRNHAAGYFLGPTESGWGALFQK